jgi:hypothetical protein
LHSVDNDLNIYLDWLDLTNLKGEKRRNVGKLNNKLSIVNQLVDLHFLLFVNITGNWKNRLAHFSGIRVAPFLAQATNTTETRIILRPLSALSLDEGLNSPCDKNASAALWKREPISDDYLHSMRKERRSFVKDRKLRTWGTYVFVWKNNHWLNRFLKLCVYYVPIQSLSAFQNSYIHCKPEKTS